MPSANYQSLTPPTHSTDEPIKLEGNGRLSRQSCLDFPERVTTEQMVRVVVTYIEGRPARMHEPFNHLALEALRAAWPCR